MTKKERVLNVIEILKKEYDGVSPRELSPLVLAYIGDAV